MLEEKIKVLILASEIEPFVKTGGLADVAGSLPKALALLPKGLEVDVRVALPCYKGITGANFRLGFTINFAGDKKEVTIKESYIKAGDDKRIPAYLIDNPYYFNRDGIYMFEDDAQRFAFFSRCSLEMLPYLGWKPDIIHCNDWHTGPVPFFLKNRYNNNKFFKNIATLYTIHNLQYQGNFPKDTIKVLGVGVEFFNPGKIEFYGTVSYMKMGIKYADLINTVSRTYAREILETGYGEKMEGLLRERVSDLYGIVNGIDYNEFDPARDPYIYQNYSSNNVEMKKINKHYLQKEMSLPVMDVPVLGIVSRLVGQKGLELIKGMADTFMKEDIQLIALGAGDPFYEKLLIEIQDKYPEKVGLYLGYNPELARKIYAGSDIFLMPSKFEPCGLGQLIALKYGTIPVVRSTGGLADTIVNYNPETGKGNGFVFSDYNTGSLVEAINNALHLYINYPGKWLSLVKKAMQEDYSWSKPVIEYLGLYRKAIKSRLPAKD